MHQDTREDVAETPNQDAQDNCEPGESAGDRRAEAAQD